MDVLTKALVDRFKEAATSLSHDDIRSQLSNTLGSKGCICDVFGDDDSGDVVYHDYQDGGTKKAPYSMGNVGGKRAASIDTDSAAKVLPRTVYDSTAADDDPDHMTTMGEAFRRLPLGLFERFVSKDERDKATASDFAGKGKSFPILKPGDVMAAVHSLGRAGSGNHSVATIHANIKKIAKRKGFPLPDSMQDADDAKESLKRLPSGEVILCESAAFTEDIPLRESGAKAEILAKIISPGRGSTGYYSKEMLARDGPQVFTKGTHMYWNHQTPMEEAQRPEGDLNHLAAVLTENAQWNDNGKDGPGLYAKAKVFQDYADKVAEKAPHTGLSIRAYGNLSEKKAPDGRGNMIEKLTRADSVDFVTKAGRDGKALTEAAREFTEGENDMDEAQVQRLIESAVGPLKAENKKLSERLALATNAPRVLRESLAAVNMPEPAKKRVEARCIGMAIVTAEGKLDEAAFKKAIEAEIKDEGAYLSSLTGGRIVVGMGSAPSSDPKDVAARESAFEESFSDEMKELSGVFAGEGDHNKSKRKAFREGRAA